MAGWTARPGCFAGWPARPGCSCRAPGRRSSRVRCSPTRDEPRLTQAVQVVTELLYPQTEITLADAQRLRPGVALGDTVSLGFEVDRADLQAIARSPRRADWLTRTHAPLVSPSSSAISRSALRSDGLDRVIEGRSSIPIAGPFRGPIEIVIDGFMLVISSLELSPHRSTAAPTVRLPGGSRDVDSCRPATIDLGRDPLVADCDFYVDAPDQAYGPWLLGDTGSGHRRHRLRARPEHDAEPAPGRRAGVGSCSVRGTATGENFVPDPCNTGYLRGHYTYADAIVVSSGFFGSFYLAEPVSVQRAQPARPDVHVDAADGRLVQRDRPRRVEARVDGRSRRRRVRGPAGSPGGTRSTAVSIQPDLDLAGAVDHGNNGSAGASSPATATRSSPGRGSSARATSTCRQARTRPSRRSRRARSPARPSTRSPTRA